MTFIDWLKKKIWISRTDPQLPLFTWFKFCYRIRFEWSLFLSLMIVTVVIHFFPDFRPDISAYLVKPNIVLEISDIAPTKQTVSAKGKPIKPVIPIAGNVREELLDDEDANLGTEFGLLPIPAPPPPPDNKEKTDFQPPRLMVSKFPEYPKELQKQGIAGIIVLEVKVDSDGKVIAHRVKTNTTKNAQLEKLAVETVYQCRYMPALVNQKPTVAWTEHKFEFIEKMQ